MLKTFDEATLPAVSVIVSAGVTAYAVYRYYFQAFFIPDLPPKVPWTMMETLRIFMTGRYISEYYKVFMNIESTVFYVRLPWQSTPLIACGDLELAKLILEGDDDNGIEAAPKNPRIYKTFDIFLGGPTLLTQLTPCPRWLAARKGVMPSFSNQNLTKTVSTESVCLNLLLNLLKNASINKYDINIAQIMLEFTFDFLTINMFGYNSFALSDDDKITDGKRFIKSLNSCFKEYAGKQIINPFRKYYFWNDEVQQAKSGAIFMQNYAQQLLINYRNNHSEEEIETDKSILAHLIRSPYTSDKERCADMLTFLIAGHDTTGYTLAWFILETSRHPHILKQIQLEINTINPDIDIPFNHNHINKLDYIGNVLREVMRMYPVTPTASNRKINRNYKVNNYTIPSGSSVSVNTYAIHRIGVEDPDSFRPDRWNKDSSQYEFLMNRHIPFSTGKRSCAGQNLAMVELKIVICTLFRLFEFRRSDEDAPMSFTTFATSKPDFPLVRVFERSNVNESSDKNTKLSPPKNSSVRKVRK